MPIAQGTKSNKNELRKHAMQSRSIPHRVSDESFVTAVAPTIAEKRSSSDGSPYLPDPYSMTTVREALPEVMSPGAMVSTIAARPDQSNPPPTPEWLIPALFVLQRKYHYDNFGHIMRRNAIDAKNNQFTDAQRLQRLREDSNLEISYRWDPRIICHDCPGKLYLTGPGKTVDNFKTHLKNRKHRKRVYLRVKKACARIVWP